MVGILKKIVVVKTISMFTGDFGIRMKKQIKNLKKIL